eukprot:TRINITY_DN26946_c0_g1_i3.p4 TRINITY_DN26946_c0_g1~~TRINITY_DN26946_c0_g1_i3.p4  ORF type:complete len:100 (+),score=33.80 TRINITY_DN26946_c0_g1_i3:65-364(+)
MFRAFFFFLMLRRPPRSTQGVSSAASDVYKRQVGITPIIEPIRGGTDGSKLSFMGLPTPNIFAGGENFHGRYEFVSVQSKEKAVAVIVEIIRQSQGYGK